MFHRSPELKARQPDPVKPVGGARFPPVGGRRKLRVGVVVVYVYSYFLEVTYLTVSFYFRRYFCFCVASMELLWCGVWDEPYSASAH